MKKSKLIRMVAFNATMASLLTGKTPEIKKIASTGEEENPEDNNQYFPSEVSSNYIVIDNSGEEPYDIASKLIKPERSEDDLTGMYPLTSKMAKEIKKK